MTALAWNMEHGRWNNQYLEIKVAPVPDFPMNRIYILIGAWHVFIADKYYNVKYSHYFGNIRCCFQKTE